MKYLQEERLLVTNMDKTKIFVFAYFGGKEAGNEMVRGIWEKSICDKTSSINKAKTW